jgi:ribosomal protein S18 acetylase RimI-like enzyme
MPLELRSFRPADETALLTICLQTGDAGKDASKTFRSPTLLGEYFATPYAAYDPTLCLMLTDESGPCGYVLGAVDTAAFVQWFNTEWLPRLQAQHAGAILRMDTPDTWLYELIKRPAKVPACAADYPAHLHIDLLPRAQGRGWGRRMIEAWLGMAGQRGARGFHLGVSPANAGALAFYHRLGLQPLDAQPGVVFLGGRLPWGQMNRPQRERA